MKQYEAVIRTMVVSLFLFYRQMRHQNVFKIKDCKWETKTPYASIRRIVQDDRFFFKIKPGLWALKSYKAKLPPEILPPEETPRAKQEEFDHTYYQGLLVEVGNLKGYETFVPNQDKNKKYLGRTLSEVASIKEFYRFGYKNVVRAAQTIDVSWFNNRRMPSRLFEVEHTTDFQGSFLKFVELQDFNTRFIVVADKMREKEYAKKLSLDAFTPIVKRVSFMDYDKLSDWHAKTAEVASLEKGFRF